MTALLAGRERRRRLLPASFLAVRNDVLCASQFAMTAAFGIGKKEVNSFFPISCYSFSEK
jgi:hypothetical protein